MFLGGLQKTTLIDFPGRVACTIFTVGCNFRCPFCHNRDLVTPDLFRKSGIKPIEEKTFLDFLDKRKKILDGVCITGGEPTLQPDLADFCQKIKKLGLAVKLDTNGSNPEVLQRLIKEKLIDFVALDIKTTFSEYEKVINVKTQNSNVKTKSKNSNLTINVQKSIKYILKSGISYEFRTTIVPGLHNKKNLIKLAKDIKKEILEGSKASRVVWFLQNFRPQNCLDRRYLKVTPFTKNQLSEILSLVQTIIPGTKLRNEGQYI